MANGAPAPSGSGSASPLRPRRRAGSDPVLVVCRCFGVVTAAAALLCVAANVLSAVYSFRGAADIIGGVFRCYAVVFSVFVAVLETEWAPIIRLWKIFEYLPARGMLQIFVAIMTKAYPNVERNELILLQEIATYMLLACGAVYIIAVRLQSINLGTHAFICVSVPAFLLLLGYTVLGVLKRSRQHKATSQEQAVKDLEELEKRREALQSLLIAEQQETA